MSNRIKSMNPLHRSIIIRFGAVGGRKHTDVNDAVMHGKGVAKEPQRNVKIRNGVLSLCVF